MALGGVLLVAAMQHPAARAAELIVSAAVSLANPFRDVGTLFEQAEAGRKIVFNFASSGVLLVQLAQGAPVDVLATADTETMDRAQSQGLLAPDTRRALLGNRLVLVVPAGSAAGVSGLQDLAAGTVRRVAIGQPSSVPAGRYAREALRRASLWEKIEPKAIFAQNARQALDYVARGEVDVGFVYATDAAAMPGKVRVAAEVPTESAIVYPVARVKDSRNRVLADAFLAFLGSAQATAVFARHGFSRP